MLAITKRERKESRVRKGESVISETAGSKKGKMRERVTLSAMTGQVSRYLWLVDSFQLTLSRTWYTEQ